jgi:hypothetical protein
MYPLILLPPDVTSRSISSEQWDKFIDGEGYEECEDFYNNLSRDFVVPTLPWSSPTLTPIPTIG